MRIVQHKKTQRRYALKYMNKTQIIKDKAVGNILSERRLLEHIDYPYIANMRYAFQDDETLFMALDLMLAGDLRLQLENDPKRFNELQVRHHVATLALSLGYLHKKRIVHRDIKPENILTDAKGYAHLADFNIATQLSPSQPWIWSKGGTIAYMAPEILARKGYSTSVDWWSLGIVTFELLFGMVNNTTETHNKTSFLFQFIFTLYYLLASIYSLIQRSSSSFHIASYAHLS